MIITYNPAIIRQGTPLVKPEADTIVMAYVELMFSVSLAETLIGVFSNSESDLVVDLVDSETFITFFKATHFTNRSYYAINAALAQTYRL